VFQGVGEQVDHIRVHFAAAMLGVSDFERFAGQQNECLRIERRIAFNFQITQARNSHHCGTERVKARGLGEFSVPIPVQRIVTMLR
jgi:hypothetical protein